MPKISYYKLGIFPFKYLGAILHYTNMKKQDLQHMDNKTIKRIVEWKGQLMSYGGKLVLLNSCISIVTAYFLSILKFSKWVSKAITSQMSHLFLEQLGQ